MSDARDISIAVIGCGAVTELVHLPAIAKATGCRATLLVDINAGRRESLASRFGVAQNSAEWAPHASSFDAAIVALPHHLHEEACSDLLRAGKAVLVEKPLTATAAQAHRLVEVEKETGGLLCVGLVRRYLWAHRLARSLIANGALGPIRSFDIREGYIYSWPVASDFLFRKESAGGGVLIDTGAHTIDALLWWLGEVESVDYRDDDEGGVEAECLLDLRMRSGATGVVELSRTRRLRNTARIVGEMGTLEVAMGGNSCSLSLNDCLIKGEVGSISSQTSNDIGLEQLSAWLSTIRNGGRAPVSARDALASIELIERCYGARRPWVLPWSQSRAGNAI